MKMAVKDEQEEASPWPEEYKIPGRRDANVKLLIKMAVKDEEEEADVQNMVKLMSCED